MSNAKQSTRGSSFVDAFLAKQRAQTALKCLRELEPRDSILDVGCGSYPFFLEEADFVNKYGLDPLASEELHLPNISLVQKSFVGEDLPFPDGHFNAITLLAVAEHLYLEDDKKLFKEIYRCLKAGGVLVLTTPTPWTDIVLRTMANIGLISKAEIEEHKVLLPIRLLKEVLVEAGFTKEQISSGYFELGMNQWVKVYKK